MLLLLLSFLKQNKVQFLKITGHIIQVFPGFYQ